MNTHQIIYIFLPFGIMASLLLPDMSPVSWERTLPEDVHCPTVFKHTSITPDHTHFEGLTVGSPDIPTVPGYWCIQETWVTECDFRWYGPSYVKKSYYRSHPSSSDCSESWHLFSQGFVTEKGFPPEECSWNNIIETRISSTSVTPREMTFDPYTQAVVDPSLSLGKCSGMICEGSSGVNIWVKLSVLSPVCLTFDRISLFIKGMAKKDGIVNYDLNSEVILPDESVRVLATGCKLNLCGSSGVLFPEGLWMNILGTGEIQETLDKLKPCARGSNIVKSHTGIGHHLHRITWESSILLSMCEDKVENLLRTGKISPRDFSIFTPLHEGPGMMYRVNNKSLESTHVNYKISELITTPGSHDFIYKQRNKTITWSTWSDTDVVGLRHGGNGIYMANGVWGLYDIQMQSSILEEFKQIKLSALTLNHLNIKIPSLSTPKQLVPHWSSPPSGGISDLGNVLPDVAKQIILAVVAIALIIISIILLIRLFSCLNYMRASKKSQSGRFEMSGFN